MKSKQTKRALISSALALVLCFVMLLGTTFAWFTDNASTSVNKVQAGTLDVALQMWDVTAGENGNGDWVSAEGKVLEFNWAETSKDDKSILWEPGCTYSLPELRIVNNGNLALKYEVYLTVTGDSSTTLGEVIEVTATEKIADSDPRNLFSKDVGTPLLSTLLSVAAPSAAKTSDGKAYINGNLAAKGETGAISISMTMQQSAGNAYQGETIEGIAVTVVATQDTVEYDSNNNEYDKDAAFANVWDGKVPTTENAEAILSSAKQDKEITISTAEQLVAWAQVASQASYETVTLKLANDISLAGYKWTPINLWYENNNRNITIDGQGHTIFGLNAAASAYDNLSVSGFIGRFNGGNLTVKNLTFSGANVTAGTYAGVVIGYQYGKVTLDNVNVLNSTLTSDASSPTELHIGGLVGASMIQEEGAGATLTLRDCTVSGCQFKGYTDTCGLVGMLADYKNHSGSYSISNCLVSDCTFDWGNSTTNQNFAVSNGASVVPGWTSIDYKEYPSGVTVTGCTNQ